MRLPSMVRARAGPLVAALGLAVSIGLAACKSIPLKDGYYSCDPGVAGSCPDGMTCAWDPEAGEYRCFSTPPGDGYVPVCGNGDVDPGEQCDGQNLGGQTCEDLGHPGGQLACSAICTFDRSGCDPPVTCGDGDIDPPAEQCDGSDLGGATCENLGYVQGTLGCLANCAYDASGCSHQECGNGVLEGNEECDASDFGGKTCVTAAERQEGQLQCTGQCVLDTAGCHTCGDGLVEGPEVCDGSNLAGETCVTRGHDGGQLACAMCSLDETGCFECGDGTCELTKGESHQNCALDCGWTTVSSGHLHTCAVKADGTAWCWGDNRFGQLGDGTTSDYDTPHQVPGIADVQAIGAGWFSDVLNVANTCALKTDGTVWCWGANNYGQLGDGTTTAKLTPVRVTGLSGVLMLGVGLAHSCALRNDGTVWCWGRNNWGTLGNGSTTDRSMPVQVSGLTDVAGISAKWQHTCALKSDQTAWCWGYNHLGRLGDGTTTTRSTPVQVLGLANVAQVRAGGDQTCAVLTTGIPWCWGGNSAGQLGDGTTTDSSVPVQVSGLADAQALCAGASYNCTTRQADTMWCWGANQVGQIGDGTTTNALVPVQVNGLVDVQVFCAGGNHTCAITNDASLWCWGLNDVGQIGDGTTTDSWTPVLVSDPY